MRILALSRYGQLGASSRQRIYQFLPYLEDHGVDVTVSPLLDDGYLRRRYADGSVSMKSVAAAYIRRFRALLRTGSFDLVWIEKEALPWLPARLERLLVGGNMPVMIDYDDAVFHQYDQNRRKAVRRLLGGKIDLLMSRADQVVACNRYIAARAEGAGARRVTLLPTVVDPDRYRRPGFNNERYTIGWIGTPGTQFYLEDIWSLLMRTCEELDARLCVIGGRQREGASDRVTYLPWDEQREGELLAGLDTGIMPLRDGSWEQGKCGYKIIQYMAAGLPVVASDTGANSDIIAHGSDGLLVSDERQWSDAFAGLAASPELRKEMGSAGRRKVASGYSIQSAAPGLLKLLQQTAARS